jgi:hypothetical protein
LFWTDNIVSVHPVERGTVEQTVTNTRAGKVKACRRAKLSPSLGGQITRLPIKEGDSKPGNCYWSCGTRIWRPSPAWPNGKWRPPYPMSGRYVPNPMWPAAMQTG